MYSVFLLLLAFNCHSGYGQSANSSLTVSQDGSCGQALNETCLGSTFGDCCSTRGFCGSTNDFCNPTAGCQSLFGSCSTDTSYISSDGKCGSTDPNSQICVGSTYGSCCSQKGWCGDSTDYCGTGCQSDFGTCGGANITTNTSDTAGSTTSSTGSQTSAMPSLAQSTTSVPSKPATAQPSVLGLEIAVGVLCGCLFISATVFLVFLLKRRRRMGRPTDPSTSEMDGKDQKTCSCGRAPIFEAPDDRRVMLGNGSRSSRSEPAELETTGYGRAELRDSHKST